MVVCEDSAVIHIISDCQIAAIELLLNCMKLIRVCNNFTGSEICSIFEVLVGSFGVISGGRAAALAQFFSEGAIGVDLVFPYVNVQLHCTEEFVNSDLTIATILPSLADAENARF
jgi:hypothetical protein